MSGMKYDGGKPLAGCILEYFPRALLAVADVSTFGANKYARASWLTVPNAHTRYSDAKMRHAIAKHIEDNDQDSGLLHAAHEAWNALAVLELELRKKDEEK